MGQHRSFIRKRTKQLFVVILVLYVALIGRLFYIQEQESHKYTEWAQKIRAREITVSATRGCIYDRSGRVLAMTVETASVFARPENIEKPRKTARKLANIIDADVGEIEEHLTSEDDFVWVSKYCDADIGDAIWDNRGDLKGIGLDRAHKRVYPTSELAAQLIGFTNIENKGVSGLERSLDKYLEGRKGEVRAELDIRGRIIPETRHVVKEPRNGHDVYLTVDSTIQSIVENALNRMAQQYWPEIACAIVMDPHSGEILALANYPGYDANDAGNQKPYMWANRAVTSLYEPGSTLKTVTVAAALNEGFNPRATIARCTGKEKIGDENVRCIVHHPYEDGHGNVDMYDVIKHSCNIGALHLAIDLGPRKMYEYFEKFGLLDEMGAGFGCETAGLVPAYDSWSKMKLANVGFGQGIAVTPLHMASVYCTIANGGVFVRPSIIKEIRDADTNVVKACASEAEYRVVSREAASQVTRMLVENVEEGTGVRAAVNGRTVAGKTGSAQITRKNGLGYEKDGLVASFIGFAPAYSPRLVIAVIVKRPHGSGYGSQVAAPVFHEIAEKALRYMKVPMDKVPTRKVEPEKKRDTGKRLA